jgi:hypothetical protein
MIIKTTVPKYGEVSSYIGKYVLDKVDIVNGIDDGKVIGEIVGAVEVDNGIELTIELFDKGIRYKWVRNEIYSIAIQ